MKIRNKILFFAIFPIITIWSQIPSYQTGTASANLIMPLSIESGNGDLDFGDVIAYGVPSKETINPQNGKEFIVKGEAKRNVTILFNDVELNNFLWLSNNNGSSGKLNFIPDVELNNSSKINSGDNIILEPDGLIGKLKINVGGTIKIESNQPVGDYQGIFTISVTY